jgi:hypothetical protein
VRLHLLSADPMVTIIGAVGRLTEAGMTVGDATDIVLRIVREESADASASGVSMPPGSFPRKASVPPVDRL